MYYYAKKGNTIYFFEHGKEVYLLIQSKEKIIDTDIYPITNWHSISTSLKLKQITKEQYKQLSDFYNECMLQQGLLRNAFYELMELAEEINAMKI